MACPPSGGWPPTNSLAAVANELWSPVPVSAPIQQARRGMTALLVLDDVGGPVTGHNVLVEGAAGGVGGLAVQIARLLGARNVIGAVSSPDKGELARELGATESGKRDMRNRCVRWR